ncbi:MAG: AMP-binding protein [Desulfobacterales bacterium]|nr:AMP-binding protein [Desulfobacterales bacterium]
MSEEARAKPPNFLEIHAATNPDKMAVIGLERSMTYGQLRERAQALAKNLYGMGVRTGDQVALMTYNLPEYAEIANALYYLQVGLVMVGYRMKPPEIEYIVDNSDSKLLIFWHEFADEILPYAEKYKKLLPDGFISFGGPSIDGAIDYESLFDNPPDVDLDNLPPAKEVGNSMIYTSGTTGRPKGASRKTDIASKPEVMDYLFNTISFLNMNPDEVHLVCCPLYHSAPSYYNTVNTILGGTAVFQPRFDAEQFLELVAKHKVTSTHLVPTQVMRLLNVSEEITSKLDISSLRSVICGAAPLFPEYKLAFLDRFGDCLYEYYGATETGINTLISPQEMRKRPGSVGKRFANNELKIYDALGNEVPDGERGILYMYNSILMEGYYKNEKATVETYRGKYMTVGDVAVRDEEGYYFIVDRIKDMSIRGGVNIYPAEVEEVLTKMPGIADAAVVGKPDPEFGEAVCAFIVRNEDPLVTEEDIKQFCKLEMQNHKIPTIIIFIDEIPRTPTGKILKRELRDKLKEDS